VTNRSAGRVVRCFGLLLCLLHSFIDQSSIGKFWHRHRRPRPVEYNSDLSFHSGLKQKEVEALKVPANKKRGAAALRATTAAAATPSSLAGVADISEPQTPSGRQNGESNKEKDNDDDRAISPVSTVSSESEAPLAHKVKVNGNHQKASPASTPRAEAARLVTGNASSVEAKSGSASAATTPALVSSPSKSYVSQSPFIHQISTSFYLLAATTMAYYPNAPYARQIPKRPLRSNPPKSEREQHSRMAYQMFRLSWKGRLFNFILCPLFPEDLPPLVVYARAT
jgi:hypothetical protein